jgi:hypothetical protein
MRVELSLTRLKQRALLYCFTNWQFAMAECRDSSSCSICRILHAATAHVCTSTSSALHLAGRQLLQLSVNATEWPAVPMLRDLAAAAAATTVLITNCCSRTL